MSEVKDPGIKLFGKTIQMSDPIHFNHMLINSYTINKDLTQNTPIPLEGEFMKTKQQEQNIDLLNEDPRTPDSSAEELIGQATSSGMSEDPKIPNADKETSSLETGNEEDQNYLNNSDGKTLTKPDKLLPCPRCSSMDTKFCYYNNYNISQPRHFCKGCQRYWTAGGTMRNVPVGSGRRKNKSSAASQYRQMLVSGAVQAARADIAANGIHHPTGSVLTFGSASPLCEPPSSFFLADKSQNCVRIGFNGQEHKNPVTFRDGENEDDISCGSSSTVPHPIEKGFSCGPESVLTNNMQGSTPHVPCFPMPPWPYPWNNAVHWSPQTPPAIGPSGYPVPFYPTPPYWGCMVPNAWNMTYLSPQPSSPNHPALSSSPLGKHSRDGSMLQPSKPGKGDRFHRKDSKRGVLVPKTLRIIEPNEAAKCSIWSTLGIKTDNTDTGTGASLFKGFLPRSPEKNHALDKSQVLQANPAAMSRSFNFQETT